MKKIFIFFLLLSVSCLFSIDNNKLINRTIIILPFYNQNDNSTYDYIYELIYDNLKNEIQDKCTILNSEEIQQTLSASGYNAKNNLYNADVKEIALNAEADIVIYGKYYIQNKSLNLTINAMDILTQEILIDVSIECNLGFETHRYISELTLQCAEKLIEHISTYNAKLISKIITKEKYDGNMLKIINKIAEQENKYWDYLVKTGPTKKMVTIPFLKNVIIFVCNQTGNYSIEINGKKNNADSNIKIVSFQNEKNDTKEFTISSAEVKKAIKYKYTQLKDYEVNIKYIEFAELSKINSYSFFIDNAFEAGISGSFGYNLRLGMGLPFRSKLENNLYIKFFIGAKALNEIKVEDVQYFYNPILKLKAGFGYEHVFYIKNLLGIYLGLEAGAEFSFMNYLVKDSTKIDLSEMILGNPAFYFSIPIGIQFFSNRRVNLILGIEPTLRIVINCFIYEDKLWFQNLDDTRGLGFEPLRQQVSDYITLDLFFFDMPILLCLRIKI